LLLIGAPIWQFWLTPGTRKDATCATSAATGSWNLPFEIYRAVWPRFVGKTVKKT